MMKFFKLFILLILFFAIFFRFNNLNWDSNQHLHPDERFLTMVNTAQKLPANIFDYFNQNISTLNPANVGYKFFVYGTFPLTLNKTLAVIFNNDDYNLLTIQGRFLSAFFDLLTLFFVYKIAQLFVDKLHKTDFNRFQLISTIPLWSAFFYAIAVYPIQLSHFFAVDTFLVFFMVGSFYFALKYHSVILARPKAASRIIVNNDSGQVLRQAQDIAGMTIETIFPLILSALFFGLALACKVSAIYILPLNLLIIFLGSVSLRGSASWRGRSNLKRIGDYFASLVMTFSIFFLTAYFILRLADPYLFQNPNFFNPLPSENFFKNIKELTVLASGQVIYPPTIQWFSKKPWFILINTAVFGVGIPYFILMIIGVIRIIFNFPIRQAQGKQISNIKKLLITYYLLLITILWILGLFTYQSFQFVKSMRYTIYLYPFFAILAGIGVNVIARILNKLKKTKQSNMRLLHFVRNDILLKVILIIVLLLWPVAFSSIYFHKHTRVEASEWIYKNLPNQSIILGEYWDDPLPLGVSSELTFEKQFRVEQIPVFDPDSPEKWQKLNEAFLRADYYILSSNRAWGSVPLMPERYPQMGKFYSDLLSGKTNYQLVKEFTSFPKFSIFNFQFSINDQIAEELFTVYDHPKVMIFKNKK